MKKILAVILSCILLIGTVQTAVAQESVPLSPLDGLKYLTQEASADNQSGMKPHKAPIKAPANLPQGTLTVTGLKEGTTVQAYRLVELESKDGKHFSNTLNNKYIDLFNALNVSSASAFSEKAGSTVLAKAQEIITAGENPLNADYEAVTAAGATSVTIDNIEYGFYYLAMTAGNEDYTIYNPLLVLVPQVQKDETGNHTYTYNVTAEAKSSQPGIEKEIVEGAARVPETTASIGDTIQYELTTPVPTYTADVDDSKVVFKITDTMSKGLTYTGGFTVYGVNEEGSETSIEDAVQLAVSTNDQTGITTIVMDFNYKKIKTYKSLRITYTAKLNEQAVIGAPGNPNEVVLSYSHDTSRIDESGKYQTKDTPKDETKVYTFGLDITKYELGDPAVTLSGAEFSLKTADDKQVYFKENDAANNTYTAIIADTQPEGAIATVTTIAGGKLIIEGLGEGTYTLTEEKAPQDYYIINKNITITITPEKNGTTLTGNVTQDSGVSEGTLSKAYYVKGIENSPDYVLPITGGIGTILFGLIAVLAAAVACVMLYKRRSE